MKSTHRIAAVFASLLVALWAMPSTGSDKLQVTVSISPQKYFVERIGGELVDITVMVEPAAEPHVYDPRPQQMVALAKSKIYFAIGVPFEGAWLDKFSSANPGMSIVHTESGIEQMPMAAHHHQDPEPGVKHNQQRPSPELEHEGPSDPHLWLSPPLVIQQARNILTALRKADPSHSSSFEDNYKRFISDLVELDLEILNLLSIQGGTGEFMVFHPAWGYFAKAYGLVQIPIEIEGKEPKAADLKSLIEYAKTHKIRVIFAQPQFSTASAKVIAQAIGARVVIADPMAQDWANNLRDVAQKIREAEKN